jgi:uncharacterized protein involved in exopolysaccharide biosynthesis
MHMDEDTLSAIAAAGTVLTQFTEQASAMLRGILASMETELDALREEVQTLRAEVHGLVERLARLEREDW